MDSEMMRFIREEIKRQVQIITSGETGATSTHTETINSLYPGMDPIQSRPISQPYGFASRAARGTISVTAQQGDHPGNKITLGHRDKDKPSDLDEGESAQYSVGKYQVRARKDKLELGKDGVWEEMVMGETLRTFLIELLDLIVAHQHQGNLGYPTSAPITASDFTSLKASNLDNSKILAKDGGMF